jgi:DNA polymerase III delta subunit
MIYIVHGNDYSKSRKLIINQQKKLTSNIKIEKDLSEITPKGLFEAASSFDLFGNPPLVVVIIPTGRVTDFERYLKILKKVPRETTIILLAQDKLAKSNLFLKNAPDLKAKVALNQKPPMSNIFKFLDHLFMQNRKGAYQELEKLNEEETEPFFILSMILYGIRNLTHAKFVTDDFLKKSGYVKGKVIRQAENFTKDELVGLFELAYQTDKNIKTGKVQKEIALTQTVERILRI